MATEAELKKLLIDIEIKYNAMIDEINTKVGNLKYFTNAEKVNNPKYNEFSELMKTVYDLKRDGSLYETNIYETFSVIKADLKSKINFIFDEVREARQRVRDKSKLSDRQTIVRICSVEGERQSSSISVTSMYMPSFENAFDKLIEDYIRYNLKDGSMPLERRPFKIYISHEMHSQSKQCWELEVWKTKDEEVLALDSFNKL